MFYSLKTTEVPLFFDASFFLSTIFWRPLEELDLFGSSGKFWKNWKLLEVLDILIIRRRYYAYWFVRF